MMVSAGAAATAAVLVTLPASAGLNLRIHVAMVRVVAPDDAVPGVVLLHGHRPIAVAADAAGIGQADRFRQHAPARENERVRAEFLRGRRRGICGTFPPG